MLDAFPEYRGQPFIEMLQHVYRTGEIISLHETCARVDGPVSGSIGKRTGIRCTCRYGPNAARSMA